MEGGGGLSEGQGPTKTRKPAKTVWRLNAGVIQKSTHPPKLFWGWKARVPRKSASLPQNFEG
jgi:hypothetical protein